MGYSARANETAQAAGRGELMSRRTIVGAMDHALELHASALRLLEAKIVAVKEENAALRENVVALIVALTERVMRLEKNQGDRSGPMID